MGQKSLLSNVRKLLDEALTARFRGTSNSKFARANGYADGYMRALLDAGLIDQKMLLQVVGDQRKDFIQKPQKGQGEQSAA